MTLTFCDRGVYLTL